MGEHHAVGTAQNVRHSEHHLQSQRKARFTADQSERLVRIIRVIERAVELFEGDKEAAQKWMNEPNRGLSWKTPADVVSSETGALEVMRLITRIEHGVYS